MQGMLATLAAWSKNEILLEGKYTRSVAHQVEDLTCEMMQAYTTFEQHYRPAFEDFFNPTTFADNVLQPLIGRFNDLKETMGAIMNQPKRVRRDGEQDP